MKIAVTGGSGELGTLVLRRLVADRKVKEVVSLDRRPPLVASPKLRAVTADVRDPGLERHFEGAAGLVHLAFLVAAFPGRAEFDSINVGGSQNVFRAAAKAGVPRIVYASSIAAYGVVPGHPIPIVEETPRVRQPDFAYSSNKYDVEAFLDEFEKEHPEIAIARLRPCILVGARMEHPLGFSLKRRRIPDTGQAFPVVWDEDVADAAILCLEKGARGAFNTVAEEVMSAADLAPLCGMKLLRSPARPLRAWARFSPLLARAGLAMPLDPSWVEKGSVPMIATSEKARRELGWKPRCPTALSVMKRYAETVPAFLDPRIGAFMGAVALGARFAPGELDMSGFDSRIHLELTGPRGGDFTIEVKDRKVRVVLGPPRPPTAVVTMKARLFLDLLAGKAEFATSQLTGAVRVEGEGHAPMVVNGMVARFRARVAALKGSAIAQSPLGRWIGGALS
jgi:nucleoside-diphosphate-sugar epimerase/putative sterol carrier protein